MSIPCRGNGNALGIYNINQTGIPDQGQLGNGGQNSGILYSTRENYFAPSFLGGVTGHLGVSTDPTKSGVVADLSDGKIVVIKY